MPKISFFLRSNNDIHKTYVVYCRVTFNATKTEFSLKEKVDPTNWNKQTQRIKTKGNQKAFLDHQQNSIEYKLKTLALQNETMTAVQLVKLLSPKKKECLLLANIVKNYIAAVQSKVKPGTLRNHNVKLQNLYDFEKATNTIYSCESFTVYTANSFVKWFINRAETSNVDTANRNVLFYKMAIQHFIQEGEKIESNLLQYIGKKDKIKPTVFLTMQDLNALENQLYVSPMLNRIRDLFLFQCYTGLSYCDLWGNWSIEDRDGFQILIGSRGKNGQSFFIPLNEKAQSIIDKYELKLPKYENAVYNRVLKELAMLSGIQKRITTHTARKTFATLMDESGWSRETVAKMLGHRSIKTTELYYLGESTKRIELEMIDRKKSA